MEGKESVQWAGRIFDISRSRYESPDGNVYRVYKYLYSYREGIFSMPVEERVHHHLLETARSPIGKKVNFHYSNKVFTFLD
jgi:hypothetical protein